MNAKIGKENILNHAGMYSLHENTGENRSRLVKFAVSKNMFIGSTEFNHKIIHKTTWKSPDCKTEYQIDHLLIHKRYLSNVMNVRSYKGANIESDHYLVGIKLRATITNAKTSTLKK
jgi:endonuclease/exonuclease/phosphatase family metal-dependent hydrolase